MPEQPVSPEKAPPEKAKADIRIPKGDQLEGELNGLGLGGVDYHHVKPTPEADHRQLRSEA